MPPVSRLPVDCGADDGSPRVGRGAAAGAAARMRGGGRRLWVEGLVRYLSAERFQLTVDLTTAWWTPQLVCLDPAGVSHGNEEGHVGAGGARGISKSFTHRRADAGAA
jgi:hypothetical protein